MKGVPEDWLDATLDTPWKAANEIRRLAAWPWARAYFAAHGVAWGRRWAIYGVPLIQRHRGSVIRAGDGFEVRSWFGTNPLGIRRRCLLSTWSADALLELGEDVGLSGATICARHAVRIGSRVMIGAGTTIVDTDFHPVDAERRREAPVDGAAAPVAIGDDCFLGLNVTVLKGASIGAGSVVGAGAVVTGTVPARSVVAGNPARVVRTLDGDAP